MMEVAVFSMWSAPRNNMGAVFSARGPAEGLQVTTKVVCSRKTLLKAVQ
jgi:hypothetical protein